MGMYFSSTIRCLDCSNKNKFDTGGYITPEPLEFIIKKKPRIICGHCKSENIQISDDYFCSVDFSGSHQENVYKPENPDLEWILPDCRQRLPEIIYLDVVLEFRNHIYKKIRRLLTFDELYRYSSESAASVYSESIIQFKRVEQLSNREDMYVGVLDKYKDYEFIATYMDIPRDDETT